MLRCQRARQHGSRQVSPGREDEIHGPRGHQERCVGCCVCARVVSVLCLCVSLTTRPSLGAMPFHLFSSRKCAERYARTHRCTHAHSHSHSLSHTHPYPHSHTHTGLDPRLPPYSPDMFSLAMVIYEVCVSFFFGCVCVCACLCARACMHDSKSGMPLARSAKV